MSKRSKLNRRRVLSSAAPARRIAPTFPLILTGPLGLSSLRVSPLLATPLVLTGFFAAPRLCAQTLAPLDATQTARRPAQFAQSSQSSQLPRLPQLPKSPQSTRSPQTLANAPQDSAQNQVVFFSIPVAVDAAVVRSGPSEDAYPTGTVGQNRYVEAYFRSADGWCAVRPPQGSFSWVNAKFVRRETDSTGRIVAASGKAVPSRVGGATVEESALVQVGLKNGTTVKILDETRLADGSTWLKISPPSGEFRWIRATDLIADPALEQLPTKLTFQREFLEQLARTSNGAPNADASALVAPKAPVSADASAAASSQTVVSPSPTSANSTQAPQTSQTTQSADVAPTPLSEESATRFKMELARLNADVFQTLRQNPPSDVELALLASRAETLFDAAPTDGERFVVQSIYDAIKIAERRNRAQFGGADAPNPRFSPNSPSQLVSPDFPNSPNSPSRLQTSEINGGDRFGEFQLEGDAPLLVLPDSSFEPSDAARSGAVLFDGSTGARFPQTAPNAQNADFNGRIDVSQFFSPAETGYSPNGFDANAAAQTEKRPRLAFAFSNANSPFRSRSSKNKEARIAPIAPQNGGRAAGISKLPPLLPTQKQLIVPPPNYRSNPLGQNVRQNARLVAAKETTTAKEAEKAAASSQNSETAQEITVDSVRWRAVDKVASDSVADSASKVVSATAVVSDAPAAVGQASPIAATVSAKAPALTGATVPQTPKGNAATGSKIQKGDAATGSNKFQPISSKSSAAFDAAGVLAKLPKAPKGSPQYALTRPVGDGRFEVVSYLETEKGVSLEPYVGRDVGVKGTLGTIQIGEETRKLTTVRTVFERN